MLVTEIPVTHHCPSRLHGCADAMTTKEAYASFIMIAALSHTRRCINESETTMPNMKRAITILAAVVGFGLLMSFRSELQFSWQSAVIAGVAFSILGLLILYQQARRG
jgi:hypothetical protein